MESNEARGQGDIFDLECSSNNVVRGGRFLDHNICTFFVWSVCYEVVFFLKLLLCSYELSWVGERLSNSGTCKSCMVRSVASKQIKM